MLALFKSFIVTRGFEEVAISISVTDLFKKESLTQPPTNKDSLPLDLKAFNTAVVSGHFIQLFKPRPSFLRTGYIWIISPYID